MDVRDLMDVFLGVDFVPRGASWDEDVDRILLAAPELMERMGALSEDADVIFALLALPSSTFAIRPIVAEGGICEDILPMLSSVLRSMDADGYVIFMQVPGPAPSPRKQVWAFYSGMEKARKVWAFNEEGTLFRLDPRERMYQPFFDLAEIESRRLDPASLN